ncbi:M1 family metallopeptidase [Mycoplasma phocimorsus]|uniref:M1 family metallopeptidase n=1 Tax=Mycoplasma phocimorsus TaxID=3045839 RepID=UPI0024BF87FD|nr:M1 family metallopeptidase [Mycoplasma phocimorsus]MDJ1646802.1 M1 family metallopeptidase [Mycoplasma phocimorsus]
MNKVKHFIEYFIPENYKLFFDIKRIKKQFCGSVEIFGEAINNNIFIHQKSLEIKSVKHQGKELNFKVNNDEHEIEIELNFIGKTSIYIEFCGKITDNMVGIYPSYYQIKGNKKEIISTQFQSHFAREAFPCIDEPAAKATFDLSLTFDNQTSEDIALSNMPEIEIEQRQKTGIYKFAKTPKMSSYLLAFVIGELQSIETLTNNGTKVAIYSTKAHNINNLKIALKYAKESIEFYERFFNIKYPLPQSFHVALPDFSAGAMENWGLVTYREVYLLANESASVSSKQGIALVVAHEVAHQWFGNLVTMKWWDDLWLNESFANMMEYVCVDHIEPKWNIIEDFQSSGVLPALKRDATDGVQSVHVEVNHPDEINTLFDSAIVYAKGSRLMHMLMRWLGKENFSKGLHNYFLKYSYSNTIGDNLWEQLSAVSNRDVKSFMSSWLNQPGYPLVTSKVINNKLIISQKQFFIGSFENKNRIWHIPLNSNWKGIPEILNKEEIIIENYSKLKKENKDVFRLNTNNTAHYICFYEGELLDSIISQFKQLDKTSKFQLLQDHNFLAQSGLISYTMILKFFSVLKNEDSSLVINITNNLLNSIKLFVDHNSKEENKLRELSLFLFKNNFERLGLFKKENETVDDEIIRSITLSRMLFAKEKSLIETAHELFIKNENNLEQIPVSARYIIIANEVENFGSMQLLDKLIHLYKNTSSPSFKQELKSAITSTQDLENCKYIISFFKDKDTIKPQDLLSWFISFLAKPLSQDLAWNWLVENWTWIQEKLGGDMSFDSFVVQPGSILKSQEKLEQFKDFFIPKLSNLALNRAIKMSINQIEAKVKLINKEKELINKKLMKLDL